MKKLISKWLVCVLVLVTICNEVAHAEVLSNKEYYKNDKGLVLSEFEYNTVIQYMDPEDLDFFNQTEFNFVMEDLNHNIGDCESIYSLDKYKCCNNKNIYVGEETYSEREMIKKISSRDNVLKSIRLMGNEVKDGEATYSTNMKKLKMRTYYTSSNTVRTVMTCDWLSIPVTKSFDIIALRFINFSYIPDTTETDNLEGYQYYNNKKIHYTHSSNNFKECNKGVGLSVNIVDSVTDSLSVKLSATVYTYGSVFTVYGTYQHSVDDISLSTSKKYDIVSENGMGDVLKFKGNVGKHYDNTKGLRITERYGA